MKLYHVAVFLVVLISGTLLSSCKTVQSTVTQSKSETKNTDESLLSEDQQQQFQYLYIEGIKQRTLGNIEDAIKIFSRCLEIDPLSTSALYEIANIHLARNDYQSSMIMLEKAVLINPTNSYYQILLAKIYQQNKLYQKAADTFGALMAMEPENKDYPVLKAEMLDMAGKSDEALSSYAELENKWGICEPISLGRQAIFIKLGKKQEAYQEVEKLIGKYPDNVKYYGLLADLYLADSVMDKALENYNKVLTIKPDEGFVHFSISNYYQIAGDYDKSYEHLKIGFADSGLDIETKIQMYMLHGQSELHRLSDNQQLELIKILIDRHIDDERPRALLAEYYLSKKLNKEAREQLRLVVEINKGNYAYWERLLYVDNDLSDWNALSEDCHHAMKYFPDQPLLHILEAVALLQQGKYKEVFSTLEAAEALANNNLQVLSQIYTYRAEAYYKQKDFEQACKWFDKVVEVDPQNFLAMNNYAYYLSLRSMKLDVAERLSNQVVKNNPNNSTYLDTYAWVLFKKKNYQLAKFYMESALSNSQEENPVLVEHYGDILFFLNEKEKALAQWEKSLKMGNTSKVLPLKIKKVVYYESVEE